MATMLNDNEIRKLIGGVIINGTVDNIRPNSYVLRLGSKGEFLDSQKEFDLGDSTGKKGIKLPPSHSVGVSSIEEIDFSKDTVDKLFPGQALHGFLSPTTDMSREGILIASTQIDAGFRGTLNWTLTNTGVQERGYVYGDAIFRLTIFKLDNEEVPQSLYDGHYQGQKGYIRSNRKGAPIGMHESEWDVPQTDGGPEELLDQLMKSGYPWNALVTQLKNTDAQSRLVSSEYKTISESILGIESSVEAFNHEQNEMKNSINELMKSGIDTVAIERSISTVMESTINKTVSDKIPQFYARAIVMLVSAFAGLIGLAIAAVSSPPVMDFLNRYGTLFGLLIVVAAILTLIISWFIGKRK